MVLITSYEPFSGGKKNNSQYVAEGVFSNLKDQIDISYCHLTTSYDLATEQIMDCVNNLPEKPKLIINIGEGGCDTVNLETRARNFDDGVGPDNSGVTRNDHIIHPGAPEFLGLNIDWSKPFCSLPRNLRNMTYASSDAGKFVCNNTMYNMSHLHSDIPYGFIHVPKHTCMPWKQKKGKAIQIVTHLIQELNGMDTQLFSPYPTDKEAITQKRENSTDDCEKEFLRRLLTTY